MTEHYTTSFCYPCIVCRVRLTTTKVKKPSGIAYIVLELIKRYNTNSTLFAAELHRFGVPNDLHHIFAKEINRLCEWDILRYQGSQSFQIHQFDSCYISDFQFTSFGSKVYTEGVIPTDERRNTFTDIYYDMVSQKFLPQKPKSALAVKDTCYEQWQPVWLDDEMIDFEELCIKKRGELRLHPEEKLYEGAIDMQTVILVKQDKVLGFSFHEKSMQLDFPTLEQESFFTANINADMLGQALRKKNKFQFYGTEPAEWSELPSFGAVERIQLPSEPIAFKGAEMTITDVPQPAADFESDSKNTRRSQRTRKNRRKSEPNKTEQKKSASIVSSLNILQLIRNICPEVSCAFFLKDGIILAVPVKMQFDVSGIGTPVGVNVVYYIRCHKEIQQQLTSSIEQYILNAPYSNENAFILARIAELNNDLSVMKAYLHQQLKYTPEDVQNCAAFAQISCQNEEWNTLLHTEIQQFFINGCQIVTIENIKSMHQTLLPLHELLNLPAGEFIRHLTAQIDQKHHMEELYHQLELLKYQENVILPLINLVEHYMQNILNYLPVAESIIQTKLSDRFIAFGQSFRKLCELTNVSDHLNYTLKENIDREKFLQIYQTYQKQYDLIKYYRVYAEKEFHTLEEFQRIFNSVQKVIVIEQMAWENPEKISEEYIQNLMQKGDYRAAICDLHIRLQYELQMYYDSKEDTFELLRYVQQDELTDEQKIGIFHQLRHNRNNLLHPNGIAVETNPEVISLWAKTLFNFMEELLNESNSTN